MPRASRILQQAEHFKIQRCPAGWEMGSIQKDAQRIGKVGHGDRIPFDGFFRSRDEKALCCADHGSRFSKPIDIVSGYHGRQFDLKCPDFAVYDNYQAQFMVTKEWAAGTICGMEWPRCRARRSERSVFQCTPTGRLSSACRCDLRHPSWPERLLRSRFPAT